MTLCCHHHWVVIVVDRAALRENVKGFVYVRPVLEANDGGRQGLAPETPSC